MATIRSPYTLLVSLSVLLVCQPASHSQQSDEEALYHVETAGDAFTAGNPAQGLMTTFHGDSTEFAIGQNRISLALADAGPVLRAQAAGSRVNFERGEIAEWFVNGPQGVEQDFTVARRHGAGPLELELDVTGDLSAVSVGEDLVFRDPGTADPILRCNRLTGQDANGRVLPLQAVVSNQAIWLEIDDSKARYPVAVHMVLTASEPPPPPPILLPPASPWPMFHHDAQRTGVGRGPAAQGKRKWMFDADNPVSSSVALGLSGKAAYVGAGDAVYALNTAIGKQLWKYETGGHVGSSPAVGPDDGGNVVYVGSDDKNVYALGAANGNLLWKFATNGPVNSSPAVSQDGSVVYITAAPAMILGPGTVYAINASNGKQNWSVNVGESSPAISPDGKTVYVGGDKLYALNAASGATLWTFKTNNSASESTPAVSSDGKTVYIGSSDKNLYAVDVVKCAANAKPNEPCTASPWAKPFKTDSEVYSSPAIGSNGKNVFAGSDDHSLYCVNAADGTMVWDYATQAVIFDSSPAVTADGKNVYIGSFDNNLYMIEVATGKEAWKFTTGAEVGSSPAIDANGVVYFGSSDGNVYALR